MHQIIETRKAQILAKLQELQNKYSDIQREMLIIQDQINATQGALEFAGILANDLASLAPAEDSRVEEVKKAKPLAANTPNSHQS